MSNFLKFSTPEFADCSYQSEPGTSPCSSRDATGTPCNGQWGSVPLRESTCVRPAARHDRCETSKLRAARASLLPSLATAGRGPAQGGHVWAASGASRSQRDKQAQSAETSKLTRDGHIFNSIMLRIRIRVENCFAGQHKFFNFLIFSPALKIGGRSTHRKYVVC